MLVFSCRTSWRLQRVESGLRLLRRSRPALLCTLSTCSKERTKWHHSNDCVDQRSPMVANYITNMRPRSAPRALVFVNHSITKVAKNINNKSKSHYPKWQLTTVNPSKLHSESFPPWNSSQFLIWTVHWDQTLSHKKSLSGSHSDSAVMCLTDRMKSSRKLGGWKSDPWGWTKIKSSIFRD